MMNRVQITDTDGRTYLTSAMTDAECSETIALRRSQGFGAVLWIPPVPSATQTLVIATHPDTSGTTALRCTECGTGNYRSAHGTTPSTDVVCTDCGKHLDTRADVAPFLEDDEYLTYDVTGVVLVHAA